MSHSCKGKCNNEKALKCKPYKDNLKWCSDCEKRIETNAVFCYCCNSRLRYRAHRTQSRQSRNDSIILTRY